jgi:hypothetical protein
MWGEVWHIKRAMPTLHVQCSTLQKYSKQYYTLRVISKPITIGVLVQFILIRHLNSQVHLLGSTSFSFC